MYDRWQDETVFSDKYDQTHKIIITKYLEHCTLNKLIFKRIIGKFDFSNLVNISSSIFPCVPVFYVFIFLLYTHRQENIFFRHFRNTRNLNPFCRVSAFKKSMKYNPKYILGDARGTFRCLANNSKPLNI